MKFMSVRQAALHCAIRIREEGIRGLAFSG